MIYSPKIKNKSCRITTQLSSQESSLECYEIIRDDEITEFEENNTQSSTSTLYSDSYMLPSVGEIDYLSFLLETPEKKGRIEKFAELNVMQHFENEDFENLQGYLHLALPLNYPCITIRERLLRYR